MIDQLGIALTGVTAVFLTQSKSDRRRRRACLFGLAGQPFWFWSAINAQQWGVTLLCCLYTIAWATGVWQYWLKPALLGIQLARFSREFRNWLWSRQRQTDLLILWPECKRLAPSLDAAKAIFMVHAMSDPAWTRHYGGDLAKVVDALT